MRIGTIFPQIDLGSEPHKVKDYCDKIKFCPTEHMKADTLTKIGVSKEIRDNIFFHNPDMVNTRKSQAYDNDVSNFLVFPSVVPVADFGWLEDC